MYSLLGWALLAAQLSWGASLSADKIVAGADEVRNPQLDYTVRVKITSIKPAGGSRAAAYEVLVKGRERSLIKTLSPANDRGNTLLQRDRSIWSYLPNLSQPVRLSLQQRLMGEVANGDLARANFSGDYQAVLMRREGPHHVLELTAKSDDVTYRRVRYWVRKDDFHPYKAEFYGSSGRLLKTCSYERFQPFGGRLRPTRLVMEDAAVKGQRSVLEYEEIRIGGLPDKFFTKGYLKKLRY